MPVTLLDPWDIRGKKPLATWSLYSRRNLGVIIRRLDFVFFIPKSFLSGGGDSSVFPSKLWIPQAEFNVLSHLPYEWCTTAWFQCGRWVTEDYFRVRKKMQNFLKLDVQCHFYKPWLQLSHFTPRKKIVWNKGERHNPDDNQTIIFFSTNNWNMIILSGTSYLIGVGQSLLGLFPKSWSLQNQDFHSHLRAPICTSTNIRSL